LNFLENVSLRTPNPYEICLIWGYFPTIRNKFSLKIYLTRVYLNISQTSKIMEAIVCLESVKKHVFINPENNIQTYTIQTCSEIVVLRKATSFILFTLLNSNVMWLCWCNLKFDQSSIGDYLLKLIVCVLRINICLSIL
jgi:hypothetical protein